jgi:hypothetical protein
VTEPVALSDIKNDLGLDPGATDQDARLERLIKAARRSVEKRIGYSIVGDAPTIPVDDIDVVRQAICLIVATWFALPEGVSVDGRAGSVELPLGVTWLLDPVAKWAED